MRNKKGQQTGSQADDYGNGQDLWICSGDSGAAKTALKTYKQKTNSAILEVRLISVFSFSRIFSSLSYI